MKVVLHGDMTQFLISLQPHFNRSVQQSINLYADLPGFISPSVITGDEGSKKKCIYILELTVGFESNLQANATRKRQKYQELIYEQYKKYEKVKFINLFGVFNQSSLDFIEMLKDLKFDERCRKYYTQKTMNTCIRSSYYIFCKRNKEWDNPTLMTY